MGPIACSPPVGMTGCPGRNGVRWSAQQMGLHRYSVSYDIQEEPTSQDAPDSGSSSSVGTVR